MQDQLQTQTVIHSRELTVPARKKDTEVSNQTSIAKLLH